MHLKVIIKMYSSTNDNNDDSRNMKEKETIRDAERYVYYCAINHMTQRKRTNQTRCSLDDRLPRENAK